MKQSMIGIHFSPSDTTRQVVEAVAAALGGPAATIDLLQAPPAPPPAFGADTLLVAGLPVFAGRLPSVCPAKLAGLQGNGAPAIALVVYGNRDYEDALLELCDILTAQGFVVVGAAAVVAQHSIYPMVATGRPDAADKDFLAGFARQCAAKLEGAPAAWPLQSTLPGNRPYRDIPSLPLKPSTNDACTQCGICAGVCPTGAIPQNAPDTTDAAKCITCTACIAACPEKARGFFAPQYAPSAEGFAQKFGARKEPVRFL